MIHGFPVALAALTAAAAGVLWHFNRRRAADKHKLPRLIAVLFGLAGFFATIGVTPWTDALAAVVSSGWGITGLLIALLILLIMFWHEVVTKKAHHHVRTPIVCMLLGICAVLLIGAFSRIGALAAKTPAKAGSALAQAVTQIHNGHASAALSASHRVPVLVAGVLVIAGLGVLGMKLSSRQGSSRGRGQGGSHGSRPAIPPAGAGSGAPAINSSARKP